jgi:KDO2-lipid IV(A) lauroyltransferase
MKKFQNYLEIAIVHIACLIVRSVPLSIALFFGRALGSFIYYGLRIRRNVATENIKRCFPALNDAEAGQIAVITYKNFGQSVCEFIRQPKMTKAYFNQKIKFVNEPLMEEAFLEGKGVLCLSGHFGNWEIMAAAIRAKGFPMMAVARDQRNPFVTAVINKYRIEVGIETIPLGIAIRGVLKALQKNKFVALLADQDAHDEGVFVDFFRQPSSTAPGIALFALKTGAPLIFGAAVRNPKGCHTVYLERIDHNDLQGVSEENIEVLTQRHTRVLEKYIVKYPDHWFWMHKRWKTKPSSIEKQHELAE